MKKPMLFAALVCAHAAYAQVNTNISCDEKKLAPIKGPVPYLPRMISPPDHDLPGDPRPQPVHKGVTLDVWHKSTDKFMTGGLALLSNGDMLELDYDGKIYHVTGMGSAETVARRALPGPGFGEALGLAVVGDKQVYVNSANSIYSYTWDGTTLTNEKELLRIPKKGGWYGWNSDVLADSNYVYVGLGSRGSIGRYDVKAGTWSNDYATSMRNNHGMGRNDAGEIWFSDNQGNYRPATPIFMLKAGKNYGVPTNGGTTGAANWQGNMGPLPDLEPYKSDMIWINYDQMSHSSTDIHFMKSGPFKGQALVGDNRAGHINRLMFDKVEGQTQGAAIRMTGGLEGPTYRIVEDSKGDFWVGGLGNSGNIYWVWCGKDAGLQKLTFKPDFLGNKSYNDVHKVALVKDGLVVTFTSDISDDFLSAANFRAYQFSYIKSVGPNYGGPKADSATVAISSIQKRSNREILINIPGLLPLSVLGLEFGNKLTLNGGLQSYELFYTMNKLSNVVPTALAPVGEVIGHAEPVLERAGRVLTLKGIDGAVSGAMVVDLAGKPQSRVDLSSLAATGRADISPLRPGVYYLKLMAGGRSLAKPFVVR